MRRPGQRVYAYWFYWLSALLLAACSLKTVYNHLDIFVADYVSDMVTLDNILARRVDTESSALHDWHRSTQLKEYASWFDALQRDLRPDISEQEVLAHFVKLETFWETLLDRMFYQSAALISLLDKTQQQELLENIEAKNAAFYEKYVDLTEAERIEQYIDRIEDTLEPWLDDLSDAQEALIAEVAGKLKPFAADRFKERQRWQQGLVNIVGRKLSAEEKTEQLRTYFKQFALNKNSTIERKKADNEQLLARFIVQLINSMDPEQKQYLISELADYARSFRELAAENK